MGANLSSQSNWYWANSLLFSSSSQGNYKSSQCVLRSSSEFDNLSRWCRCRCVWNQFGATPVWPRVVMPTCEIGVRQDNSGFKVAWPRYPFNASWLWPSPTITRFRVLCLYALRRVSLVLYPLLNKSFSPLGSSSPSLSLSPSPCLWKTLEVHSPCLLTTRLQH